MTSITINLPECDVEGCKPHLTLLIQALRSHGLSIAKYPITGPYSEYFKENFEKCEYTIIHKCCVIWKLINTGLRNMFFLKESPKIAIVSFPNGSDSFNCDSQALETFEGCFVRYRVSNVSDSPSVNRFVHDLEALARKREETRVNTSETPDADPRKALNEKDYVSSRELHLYVSKFGNEKKMLRDLQNLRAIELRDRESNRMKLQPFSEEARLSVQTRKVDDAQQIKSLLSFDDLSSFSDLKRRIDIVLDDPHKALINITFLVQKVLPELYKCNQALAILIVSTCHDLVLQKQAVSALELMLLRGIIAEPQVDLNHLQKMITMLADNICEIRDLLLQDQSTDQEAIFRRKCILFLMLQGEMLTACRTPKDLENSQKFNKDLKKVFGTPGKHSGRPDKYLDGLLTYLDLPLIQVEKNIRRVIVKLAAEKYSKMKAKRKQTEFFYVFVFLKKVFSSKGSEMHTLLQVHRKKKSRLLWKQSSAFCLELILRGFTQFLSHSAKESSHSNLSPLCSEIGQIIIATVKKDQRSFNDLVPSLRALMFRQAPPVRQCAMDVFARTHRYIDSVAELMIEAVEHLTFPVLKADRMDRLKLVNQKCVSGWLKVSGNFCGHKSVIVIHVPTEKDHRASNRSDVSDTRQFRQIEVLSELSHGNVVTIFAYNKNHIPQFVVTEEVREENLQEYLVNRSINKTVCTVASLLKFVIQAAAAVEFCHHKNIVHRNITAASFSITGTDTVKLGAFHMAYFPSPNETERVFALEDCRDIPTQWSAPESLRRCKFSKQSDVWMFGHLCFEILTHGALPYSQLGLGEDAVIIGIFKSSIQLNSESCINKDTFHTVILPCVHVNPYQRLKSLSLKNLLIKTQKNLMADQSLELHFPDLQNDHFRPATELTKGIPTVNYEFCTSKVVPRIKLTDSIELFQEENEFIVKQHVKGSLKTELKQRIREGLLDNILPFLSIKQILMNEYIVEILMPYPYVGTVLEMVAKQEIAKTESEFKKLLYQIASVMDTLHQSKALAGEIRASQLFVEKVSNGDLKVHPIFFSSLNTLTDKRSSIQVMSIENQVLMERAAPEIRDDCSYSQASDVYSFGILIWDLAEARSCNECPFPGTDLAVNHSSAGWEDELESEHTLNSHATPRLMGGNLLKVMGRCLRPDARNRPTMEEICRLLSSEGTTEDDNPISETSDYSTLPGSERKDSANSLEVDPLVTSNGECLQKVVNPSSIFSQSDRATVTDSGIFSLRERKDKYGSIQDMFKSHQSLACSGPPYAEYLTLDSMPPPEDDAHSLSEYTDLYQNIDPESVHSSSFSDSICESVRADSPVDQSPPRLPPRNLHFPPFLNFNTSGLTDSATGNAIYEVIGEPTLLDRCISLNLVSVDHNEA